jgi:hypothetical protein
MEPRKVNEGRSILARSCAKNAKPCIHLDWNVSVFLKF